jgi:hypothetical protein
MQLIRDIQTVSECEWLLMRIEDLGDCIGTCQCGKKWVRYYYYLRHNASQRYACLCPSCIKMLPRIAAVTDLLHVFFHGVTATFVHDGEGGNHLFAVNSNFPFAKRKSEIAREFFSIPIRTHCGTTILVVQRQHKFSFVENTYYEIRLKPVICAGALMFELIAAEPFGSTIAAQGKGGLLVVSPPPSRPPPRSNPVLPINFYIKHTPVYCTI